MNAKQFKKRLKEIYSHTKRSENDSSFDDICNALMTDVRRRSNRGWDESIAAETIKFAEHIFKVQPDETKAALLVKSKDAEVELNRFLADRGYTYTHIAEGDERSPDGYIEGFNSKYLCELKSPVLMFDHDTAPFGYKFKTTHSKILNAIHEAKDQFEKHDSKHALPRILAYTSALPQLDYNAFADAIRGYRVAVGSKIESDFRETEIFKATTRIIGDIDLYIFFRISSDKKFIRVVYFSNDKSSYAEAIHELIDHLKSKQLSSMDGQISIQDITGESE